MLLCREEYPNRRRCQAGRSWNIFFGIGEYICGSDGGVSYDLSQNLRPISFKPVAEFAAASFRKRQLHPAICTLL
jgi:hypothetical protein